jgi:hypothetical protein
LTIPDAPGALGRNAADPRRLARTVRLRLTGVVPAHPPAADFLTGVPRWCLGANTRYGTCGPTYVANSAVLTWHWLLGEDITVTDDQVFDLYRRSGNPGFDPATGAGDNGVDMTVMLAELARNGIGITHPGGQAETVKPVCFAAVDTSIDDVRAVTSIFGSIGFGLDLDLAQRDQTRAGLWDYAPGSAPWGGHATLGGSYTSAARGRDESLVTWASVVGTTDAFLARQLPEAYVIVWPAIWARPAFQAGVDQAALAAAYQAFTGRPFPLPVAPPPGGDVRADAADRELAAGLPAGWATAPHGGPNKRAARAVRAWLARKNLP